MAGNDPVVPSQEALMEELIRAHDEINNLKHMHEESEKVWAQKLAQVKNESLVFESNLQNEAVRRENIYRREIDFLLNRVKHLHRMICTRNCVLLAILFIYEHVLKITGLCVPQLERIIFTYAREVFGITIDSEHLECEKLMGLLLKCQMVSELDVGNVYTPGTPGNDGNGWYKAWTKIMTIPDDGLHILILGRIHELSNGIGHVEICDLRSRSWARDKITIYDPQTNLDGSGSELNVIDFRHHVKDDGGLRLFMVNYDTLRRVLETFGNIFHSHGT